MQSSGQCECPCSIECNSCFSQVTQGDSVFGLLSYLHWLDASQPFQQLRQKLSELKSVVERYSVEDDPIRTQYDEDFSAIAESLLAEYRNRLPHWANAETSAQWSQFFRPIRTEVLREDAFFEDIRRWIQSESVQRELRSYDVAAKAKLRQLEASPMYCKENTEALKRAFDRALNPKSRDFHPLFNIDHSLAPLHGFRPNIDNLITSLTPKLRQMAVMLCDKMRDYVLLLLSASSQQRKTRSQASLETALPEGIQRDVTAFFQSQIHQVFLELRRLLQQGGLRRTHLRSMIIHQMIEQKTSTVWKDCSVGLRRQAVINFLEDAVGDRSLQTFDEIEGLWRRIVDCEARIGPKLGSLLEIRLQIVSGLRLEHASKVLNSYSANFKLDRRKSLLMALILDCLSSLKEPQTEEPLESIDWTRDLQEMDSFLSSLASSPLSGSFTIRNHGEHLNKVIEFLVKAHPLINELSCGQGMAPQKALQPINCRFDFGFFYQESQPNHCNSSDWERHIQKEFQFVVHPKRYASVFMALAAALLHGTDNPSLEKMAFNLAYLATSCHQTTDKSPDYANFAEHWRAFPSIKDVYQDLYQSLKNDIPSQYSLELAIREYFLFFLFYHFPVYFWVQGSSAPLVGALNLKAKASRGYHIVRLSGKDTCAYSFFVNASSSAASAATFMSSPSSGLESQQALYVVMDTCSLYLMFGQDRDQPSIRGLPARFFQELVFFLPYRQMRELERHKDHRMQSGLADKILYCFMEPHRTFADPADEQILPRLSTEVQSIEEHNRIQKKYPWNVQSSSSEIADHILLSSAYERHWFGDTSRRVLIVSDNPTMKSLFADFLPPVVGWRPFFDTLVAHQDSPMNAAQILYQHLWTSEQRAVKHRSPWGNHRIPSSLK